MRKKLSIVFALVLVLCFGTMTFAQNDNGSPKMGGSDKHSMGGHRHGRRHHRRRRRHNRRHGRHDGGAKTGNGNTH